jgi:hypothetical protein
MSIGAPGMSTGWVGWARGLYLTAIAVFVVTVLIGILNGLDLVEFPRDVLLTHVHAGTLGWITLGIVATAFWLFGTGDRWLAVSLAVLVPVYAAAFYTGNLPARAVTGTALLVAIAWLLVWTWRTYLAGERTLPRLSVTLGLTTFAYGAVLGVVLQIQFATGNAWLSGDAIGAHASAMVFAYVVLATMGLIEWRLRGTTDLPRGGVVQVGALFVGGLILSVGLLAGQGQAAGGLYLLAELVAVVLFVVRVIPAALRTAWLAPGPARQVGVAALWVLVALLLFMYLVATFIAAPDPEALPLGVLIASDHAVFVGVVTNLLLALTAVFATRVPARWPAADHLVFWGVNAGLAVFVVGLIAESSELKRIGSPVMGVAILLGLAVVALRLWAVRDAEPG